MKIMCKKRPDISSDPRLKKTKSTYCYSYPIYGIPTGFYSSYVINIRIGLERILAELPVLLVTPTLVDVTK